MKNKCYVIDTSGFIVGIEYMDGVMVTVPKVQDEILDSTTKLKFDLLYDRGLRVEKPLKVCANQVTAASVLTGDYGILSGTDIDILAKALELTKTYQVILITDDYAIQNVASHLGIKYMYAGLNGINKTIKWEMKCTGCGATVAKGSECPICGCGIRRRRVKH